MSHFVENNVKPDYDQVISDIADYVLSKFSKEEMAEVKKIIDEKILLLMLEIHKLMNKTK